MAPGVPTPANETPSRAVPPVPESDAPPMNFREQQVDAADDGARLTPLSDNSVDACADTAEAGEPDLTSAPARPGGVGFTGDAHTDLSTQASAPGLPTATAPAAAEAEHKETTAMPTAQPIAKGGAADAATEQRADALSALRTASSATVATAMDALRWEGSQNSPTLPIQGVDALGSTPNSTAYSATVITPLNGLGRTAKETTPSHSLIPTEAAVINSGSTAATYPPDVAKLSSLVEQQPRTSVNRNDVESSEQAFSALFASDSDAPFSDTVSAAAVDNGTLVADNDETAAVLDFTQATQHPLSLKPGAFPDPALETGPSSASPNHNVSQAHDRGAILTQPAPPSPPRTWTDELDRHIQNLDRGADETGVDQLCALLRATNPDTLYCELGTWSTADAAARIKNLSSALPYAIANVRLADPRDTSNQAECERNLLVNALALSRPRNQVRVNTALIRHLNPVHPLSSLDPIMDVLYIFAGHLALGKNLEPDAAPTLLEFNVGIYLTRRLLRPPYSLTALLQYMAYWDLQSLPVSLVDLTAVIDGADPSDPSLMAVVHLVLRRGFADTSVLSNMDDLCTVVIKRLSSPAQQLAAAVHCLIPVIDDSLRAALIDATGGVPTAMASCIRRCRDLAENALKSRWRQQAFPENAALHSSVAVVDGTVPRQTTRIPLATVTELLSALANVAARYSDSVHALALPAATLWRSVIGSLAEWLVKLWQVADVEIRLQCDSEQEWARLLAVMHQLLVLVDSTTYTWLHIETVWHDAFCELPARPIEGGKKEPRMMVLARWCRLVSNHEVQAVLGRDKALSALVLERLATLADSLTWSDILGLPAATLTASLTVFDGFDTGTIVGTVWNDHVVPAVRLSVPMDDDEAVVRANDALCQAVNGGSATLPQQSTTGVSSAEMQLWLNILGAVAERYGGPVLLARRPELVVGLIARLQPFAWMMRPQDLLGSDASRSARLMKGDVVFTILQAELQSRVRAVLNGSLSVAEYRALDTPGRIAVLCRAALAAFAADDDDASAIVSAPHRHLAEAAAIVEKLRTWTPLMRWLATFRFATVRSALARLDADGSHELQTLAHLREQDAMVVSVLGLNNGFSGELQAMVRKMAPGIHEGYQCNLFHVLCTVFEATLFSQDVHESEASLIAKLVTAASDAIADVVSGNMRWSNMIQLRSALAKVNLRSEVARALELLNERPGAPTTTADAVLASYSAGNRLFQTVNSIPLVIDALRQVTFAGDSAASEVPVTDDALWPLFEKTANYSQFVHTQSTRVRDIAEVMKEFLQSMETMNVTDVLWVLAARTTYPLVLDLVIQIGKTMNENQFQGLWTRLVTHTQYDQHQRLILNAFGAVRRVLLPMTVRHRSLRDLLQALGGTHAADPSAFQKLTTDFLSVQRYLDTIAAWFSGKGVDTTENAIGLMGRLEQVGHLEICLNRQREEPSTFVVILDAVDRPGLLDNGGEAADHAVESLRPNDLQEHERMLCFATKHATLEQVVLDQVKRHLAIIELVREVVVLTLQLEDEGHPRYQTMSFLPRKHRHKWSMPLDEWKQRCDLMRDEIKQWNGLMDGPFSKSPLMMLSAAEQAWLIGLLRPTKHEPDAFSPADAATARAWELVGKTATSPIACVMLSLDTAVRLAACLRCTNAGPVGQVVLDAWRKNVAWYGENLDADALATADAFLRHQLHLRGTDTSRPPMRAGGREQLVLQLPDDGQLPSARCTTPLLAYLAVLKLYTGKALYPNLMLWANSLTTTSELKAFFRRVKAFTDHQFVIVGVEQLSASQQSQLLDFSRELCTHVDAAHAPLTFVVVGTTSIFTSSAAAVPWVRNDQLTGRELAVASAEAQRSVFDSFRAESLRLYVIKGGAGHGKTHYIKTHFLDDVNARVVRARINRSLPLAALQQCLANAAAASLQSPHALQPVVLYVNASFEAPLDGLHRLLFDLIVAGLVRSPRSGRATLLPSAATGQSAEKDDVKVVVEVSGGENLSRLLEVLASVVIDVDRMPGTQQQYEMAVGGIEERRVGAMLSAKYFFAGPLTIRTYDARIGAEVALDYARNDQHWIELYQLHCVNKMFHVRFHTDAGSVDVVQSPPSLNGPRLRTVAFLKSLHGRAQYFYLAKEYRFKPIPTRMYDPRFWVKFLQHMLLEASWVSSVLFPVDVASALPGWILRVHRSDDCVVRLLVSDTKRWVGTTYELANFDGPLRPFKPESEDRAAWIEVIAFALGFASQDGTVNETEKAMVENVLRKQRFVLLPDYALRLVLIHDRKCTKLPLIIESQTGVGKTFLLATYADLLNAQLLHDATHPAVPRVARAFAGFVNNVYARYKDHLDTMMRIEGFLKLDQLLKDNRQVFSDRQLGRVSGTTQGSNGGELKDIEFLGKLAGKLIEQVQDPSERACLIAEACRLPFTVYTTMRLMERNAALEANLRALSDAAESSTNLTAEQQMALVDRFARALAAVSRQPLRKLFFRLLVHPGITEVHVSEFLTPAIAVAVDVSACEVVVFFDEVNTSTILSVFHELFVDRTLGGQIVPANIFFVGAINPFTITIQQELDELQALDPSRSGPYPTSYSALYTVHQLPSSLNEIRWSFAPLFDISLQQYIRGRIDYMVEDNAVNFNAEDRVTIGELIRICHGFVGDATSGLGPGSVSQRDIQRVFKLLPFLHHSLQLQPLQAGFMAAALVYYLRLPPSPLALATTPPDPKGGAVPARPTLANPDGLDAARKMCTRQALSEQISQTLDVPDFAETVDRIIQNVVAPAKRTNLIVPEGVAINQALRENIFTILVAIYTKVPLAIIGPPGCSKTLAVQTVVHNLKGKLSPTEFCRRLDPISPYYCQCSEDSTPSDISAVLDAAIESQDRFDQEGETRRCVVFLDEASLPDRQRMVLKVLHSYLDDCSVAFVAISNAPFDSANANRMMQVLRSLPSLVDMRLLALSCLGVGEATPHADMIAFADGLCAGFFGVLEDPALKRRFHYRDFVFMLRQLRRDAATVDDMMQSTHILRALERNFNGVPPDQFRLVVEVFFQSIAKFTSAEIRLPNHVEYSSTEALLRQALKVAVRPNTAAAAALRDRARFKLVIDPSGDESGARLLFELGLLNSLTEIVHLSVLPMDENDNYRAGELSRIKFAMEQGTRLLLVRSGPIHGNLYDVFNQTFSAETGPNQEVFSKIAIGSRTKDCAVHQDFECIVHLPASSLPNTPAPFLSRFEKYYLDLGECFQRRLLELGPPMRAAITEVKARISRLVDLVGPLHIYGWTKGSDTSLMSLLLSHMGSQGGSFKVFTELTVEHEKLARKVVGRADGESQDADTQLLVRALVLRVVQLVPPEVAMVRLLPRISPARVRNLYSQAYFSSTLHFSLEGLAQVLLGAVRTAVKDSANIVPSKKVLVYTRASASSLNLPNTIAVHWDPTVREHVATVEINVSDATEASVRAHLLVASGRSATSVVIVCFVSSGHDRTARISFVRHMIDTVAASTGVRTNLAWILVVSFAPELLYKRSCYPAVFLHGWDFAFCDSCISASSYRLRQALGLRVPATREQRQRLETTVTDGMLDDALRGYCVRLSFSALSTPAAPLWLDSKIRQFYEPTARLEDRVQILRSTLDGVKILKRKLLEVANGLWQPAKLEQYLRSCAMAALNGEAFGSLGDAVSIATNNEVLDSLAMVLNGICSDFGLHALVRNHNEKVIEKSLPLLYLSDSAAVQIESPFIVLGSNPDTFGHVFLFRHINRLFERIISQLGVLPAVDAVDAAVNEYDPLADLLSCIEVDSPYLVDYALELVAPLVRANVGSAEEIPYKSVLVAARIGAAWLLADDDNDNDDDDDSGGGGGREHTRTGRRRIVEMHATVARAPAALLVLLSSGRIAGFSTNANSDTGRLRDVSDELERLYPALLQGTIKRTQVAAKVLLVVQKALFERLAAVADALRDANAHREPAAVGVQGVPGLAEWISDVAFFNIHVSSGLGMAAAQSADLRSRCLHDLLTFAWVLLCLDERTFAPDLRTDRVNALVVSAHTMLNPAAPLASVLHDKRDPGRVSLERAVSWLLEKAPATAAPAHPVKMDVAEWFLGHAVGTATVVRETRDTLLRLIGDCASVPMPRRVQALNDLIDQSTRRRRHPGSASTGVPLEHDTAERDVLASIAAIAGASNALAEDISLPYIPMAAFVDSIDVGIAGAAGPAAHPLVDMFFWHAVDRWDDVPASPAVNFYATTDDEQESLLATSWSSLLQLWPRFSRIRLSSTPSLEDCVCKGVLKYLLLRRFVVLFVRLAVASDLAAAVAWLASNTPENLRMVRSEVLGNEVSTETVYWVASVATITGLRRFSAVLTSRTLAHWLGVGWTRQLSSVIDTMSSVGVPGVASVAEWRVSFATTSALATRSRADLLTEPAMFAELYGLYADVAAHLAAAIASAGKVNEDIERLVKLVDESLQTGLSVSTLQMLLILALYYDHYGSETRMVNARMVFVRLAARIESLLRVDDEGARVLCGLLWPRQSFASLKDCALSRLFAYGQSTLSSEELQYRHFLVNLLALVVGGSNGAVDRATGASHLWTMLFHPEMVCGTYPFSSTRSMPQSGGPCHFRRGYMEDDDVTVRVHNADADALPLTAAYLASTQCWSALALSMLLPETAVWPVLETAPAGPGPKRTTTLYNSLLDPSQVDRCPGQTVHSQAVQYCYTRVIDSWSRLKSEPGVCDVLPTLLTRSLERYSWLICAGAARNSFFRAVYTTVDAVRAAERAFSTEVWQYTVNSAAFFVSQQRFAQSASERLRRALNQAAQPLLAMPLTANAFESAFAAIGASPKPPILRRFVAVRAQHRLIAQIPPLLRLYEWVHSVLCCRISIEASAAPINVLVDEITRAGNRFSETFGVGPDSPRAIMQAGVDAFNHVQAVLEVGNRLSGATEGAPGNSVLVRIDPDTTALYQLLSTADSTNGGGRSDVLWTAITSLCQVGNDFFSYCKALVEDEAAGTQLDPVSRLLLRAAGRTSSVNVREVSSSGSRALLLTLDDTPGSEQFMRLVRRCQLSIHGSTSGRFDYEQMQHAILLAFVVGRRPLSSWGVRTQFRFANERPIKIEATREEAITERLHLPDINSLNDDQAANLAYLSSLHIDELMTTVSIVEAARVRFLTLPRDAQTASLKQSLQLFLKRECRRPDAGDVIPSGVTVELLEAMSTTIASCIRRWTELSRQFPAAVSKDMPPEVEAEVQRVIESCQKYEADAVAEVLELLSESVDDLVARAESTDGSHSLVAGFEGIYRPDLFSALPVTLLDRNAAHFQRLLLRHWSTLRQRLQEEDDSGRDAEGTIDAEGWNEI